MARKQYDTVIDYYFDNKDAIYDNCVIDETSAHNTFQNLILMYAGCVSQDALAAQKVHDAIVNHLHLHCYCTNLPLMVEGGLFVLAGKKKVVMKKFEVEDTIGKLWAIMQSLKLDRRLTEKFHQEAHEIAVAIRTYTKL